MTIAEEIALEKTRKDKAQPTTGDQDLFVLLAILGAAFGEVQQSALAHARLAALPQTVPHALGTTAREFRTRLVQLGATTLKALELYDVGQIATYSDDTSSSNQDPQTIDLNPS
jgi:hypothetical protein